MLAEGWRLVQKRGGYWDGAHTGRKVCFCEHCRERPSSSWLLLRVSAARAVRRPRPEIEVPSGGSREAVPCLHSWTCRHVPAPSASSSSVCASAPPPVCLLYKGQKSLDVGPTCVIGGDRVSRTFTEYPPRPFSQTPRCSRLFHRSGCGYIFLRAGFRPPTDAENRYLKTCLLLLGRLIRSVCSAHSKACCDCGEVTLTARRWGCSASVRGMSPLGSHRFMSSHVLWF